MKHSQPAREVARERPPAAAPDKRLPRLIFVNRFYYPDHSATAQILTDLTRFLANEGWDVHVVASRSLYADPSVRLVPHEVLEGVTVHRVWTSHFGRGTLLGRLLDYASYYPFMIAALLRLVRASDIVVAKTDPPLAGIPAGAVARIRGARLVNWLQDLYPEVAVEMGIGLLGGVVGRVARGLRNRSLNLSAMNVAIGQAMAHRLRGEGVEESKIAIIPNWSDDGSVRPLRAHDHALRTEWGLSPRDFVVGYSGNLGRAHEAETLLAAARLLRDRREIRFLFVGGGYHSESLVQRAREEGLESFVFKPYQPRDRLALSLSTADVHWLSLRPSFEGLVLPSKFYGIAAAGRPIIAVTAVDGEIARLVTEHRCGVAVACGDAAALANVLRSMAADPEGCMAMGARARTMLDAQFSRQSSLSRWNELLSSLAHRGQLP